MGASTAPLAYKLRRVAASDLLGTPEARYVLVVHRYAGLVFFIVLVLAGGCSSSEPSASSPEAVAQRPKNAHVIAREIVGGKVGALVFVDRARGNPTATKFLQLGAVKDLLDGTSFDPMRDIERAYGTGPSVSDRRGVVFAEHTLTPERVAAAVQDMVRKSDTPAVVIQGGPEWRVRVSKKNQPGTVAFIPPRFVVIVPPDLENQIDRFENTGGLPGPTGSEVAKLFAIDPSTSLRAKGVPPVPPSISSLDADVLLRSDGGVTIDGTGQSTPDRASQDAAELTKNIDDATSIGFGLFRIRAFRPIVFSPSGDHIVTHHELSAGEVDTLMTLAAAFVQ
jgi:hypothetical protein